MFKIKVNEILRLRVLLFIFLLIQLLLLIYFCIPENLNTNLSHQLFDYKITLEFLVREHKFKGDIVIKNRF